MGRRRRVIEAELYAALQAAPWIEQTDRGATRMALRLAEQIDRMYEPAQGTLLPLSPVDQAEVAGKLGYIAQQYAVYLDRLLLTPRARLDAGTGEETGSDLLASVRDLITEGEYPAADRDSS